MLKKMQKAVAEMHSLKLLFIWAFWICLFGTFLFAVFIFESPDLAEARRNITATAYFLAATSIVFITGLILNIFRWR